MPNGPDPELLVVEKQKPVTQEFTENSETLSQFSFHIGQLSWSEARKKC